MSRTIRIQFSLAWLFIAVLAVAVVILYSWILDRKNPVEVLGGEPNPQIIKLGEPLKIDWVIHKKRNCLGTFVRQVIDSDGVVWDLFSDNESTYLPVSEEPASFTKAYVLPRGVATGNARFKTTVTWECNPLQKRRQEIANLRFTIID